MSSRYRSPNSSNASNKLRLDSLNKILKIDVGKRKQRGSIAKQVSTIALSELLRDTPSRLKNVPDFKVFLSNEENVQLFRDFLKTQYCHENLDFYLACEKYRNLDPNKVGEEIVMKFMANQIYNDYLAENARQPINVDNSCRLNIANKMKNPGPDLLVEAQTEIFNLMRADCYPRFCKTWQLDKETARRILCERAIIDSGRKSTRTNDSNSTSMSSTRCDLSSYSNDSRISKKKLFHHSHVESCPSDCPYQRIALPCRQHKISEGENISRQTGCLEKIDLKPPHIVPKNVLMRSPPPPPLPPKPRRYQTRSSPIDDPKLHPYVGKVFHI